MSGEFGLVLAISARLGKPEAGVGEVGCGPVPLVPARTLQILSGAQCVGHMSNSVEMRGLSRRASPSGCRRNRCQLELPSEPLDARENSYHTPRPIVALAARLRPRGSLWDPLLGKPFR